MKNPRIFEPRHHFAATRLFSANFLVYIKPGWVGFFPRGGLPHGVAASQSGFTILPKLRHYAHRNYHTTGTHLPGAPDYQGAQRRTRRQHGAAGQGNSPRIFVEKKETATAGNAAVNAYLSGVSNFNPYTRFFISSLPAK